MLCSSGVGGDGDAAIIVNSLKINCHTVTFNSFNSSRLPGSLCKPLTINHNSIFLHQVPSNVTLDTHLPAPSAPSHAEAQAWAPESPNLGLTTTLVPASSTRAYPLKHLAHLLPLPYDGKAATSLALNANTPCWSLQPPRSFLNPRAKPWGTSSPKVSTIPVSLLAMPSPQLPHVDPLVSAATSMCKQFTSSSEVDGIVRLIQQPMVRAPTSTFHPAAELLASYSTNGFPALVGEKWPMTSILSAIKTGPHTSTLSREAVHFVRGELLDRTKRGFSNL